MILNTDQYRCVLWLLVIFFQGMFVGCSDDTEKRMEDPPMVSEIVLNELEVDLFEGDDLLDKDYNLLFIGNSLTYTNDLPKLVRQRAAYKNLKIGTKMVALPNYAIIDHWNYSNTQKLIESGKFDFVIIQQGPSSRPYSLELLIEGGKRYSEICREFDVQLVYFMVWPSRTYYDTFDAVIANHIEAANLNEALLCPVGKVWKKYFDETDTFDYYSLDGFHPSLKGSQVAADVIIQTLF